RVSSRSPSCRNSQSSIGRLAIFDTWIEKHIQDVHRQVHEDKAQREQEYKRLHLRIITQGNSANAEGAYTRHRKDGGDHNRPPDQEPYLESQHRDRWDQRVFQSVIEDHGSFPYTFG